MAAKKRPEALKTLSFVLGVLVVFLIGVFAPSAKSPPHPTVITKEPRDDAAFWLARVEMSTGPWPLPAAGNDNATVKRVDATRTRCLALRLDAQNTEPTDDSAMHPRKG